MKKNWFLTDTDQIINLNEFTSFYILYEEGMYLVKSVRNDGIIIQIGDFEEYLEAKGNLAKIYNQLWEEEYQENDGTVQMDATSLTGDSLKCEIKGIEE